MPNQAPTNLTLSTSTIAENQVIGTVVGNLTTTDPDTANTFTYSLVAGNGATDNSLFTITNNQLKTNSVFNFETKNSYSIRVKTTDQGGLSFEKQLTIGVNNVNETPTNLTLSTSTVAENQAIGTVVGNLTTTDPDTANTFTYSLVAGNGATDNSLFTITNNQLKTNSVFNFETKNSYSIRVKTTDQGGLSFEKQLTIGVSNVNETPTLVGSYDTPGYAYGVQVVGNYAYVADGGTGVQIIDISNPTNPTRKGSYDTPNLAIDVQVVGDYAYVADYWSGLQIIDISNPTNPTRKGNYDTPDLTYVVQVVGNYAYVADFDSGLQIIDISNPTNPTRKGNYDTSGYASRVQVVGNYAYVADDYSGLQIIDISNPTNPTRKGSYDTSDLALGVQVVGNYAYVANGSSGLQIIDISNPTNPTLKGNYDTSGYAWGVQVVGSYAYVADDEDGLKIIDVSDFIDSPRLQKPSNVSDVFVVKGDNNDSKERLEVKLTGYNSKLNSELGVFIVDDANGTIDGIAPGAAGYTDKALQRGQVIFSLLGNPPAGFDQSSLSRLLEFNSNSNLRFYLVKDGSTDSVLNNTTPKTNVLFDISSTLRSTPTPSGNGFSLAWEDGSGNTTGFEDLRVTINPTDTVMNKGTSLQNKPQRELLDLRNITGPVTANFVVNREAAYNNFVGFYKVTDENGGIDTNGDGRADILPRQAGYAQAAVRGRVSDLALAVNNNGTANFNNKTLQGGSVLAPFIITDGGTPDNYKNIYFTFLGANSDGVDHVRLLGDNTFGFEDLVGGGDKDFNDVIVKVNLTV